MQSAALTTRPPSMMQNNTRSLFGLNVRSADEATSRFWQMVNRRINEAPELSTMLAAGFQPEITGGGGLAWRKNLADGSFLFVNYYDWDVGGEPDEPIWIGGRYMSTRRATAKISEEMLCDVTLPAAMAFVEKLEKTYGLARPAPTPAFAAIREANHGNT